MALMTPWWWLPGCQFNRRAKTFILRSGTRFCGIEENIDISRSEPVMHHALRHLSKPL